MPDQALRQAREACAERPPRSQVISSSRYVFDLDQRVIRIEDRDFVFIASSETAERISHALTVPVKAINPKTENSVIEDPDGERMRTKYFIVVAPKSRIQAAGTHRPL